MKKSTLIIASLALLSAGLLQAEEGALEAQQPDKPFQLAATLPAMKSGNPVQYLPGMPAASLAAAAALPQPLITDLTNFPTPFDSRKSGVEGTTVISYQLAKDAKVTVEIYDLLGLKVRGWDFAPGVNGGRQNANTLTWDGTNEAGQKVSKGGYLAEIVVEVPETTATVIRKIGVIH